VGGLVQEVAVTRVEGKLVVASVSGGKDSGALSLWLTEQGIEHRRVHMLTGWDHQVTLDYLRGPLTAALGPIEEIRGDLLMPDLVRKKGMFPSRVRRFCTEELKVKPVIRYIERLQDEGHDVVNAVGVRAAESEARAKLGEWEWQDAYDAWVWRPLISWTEQDVIDIHTRHGLRPNPLYLQGASRVGCWPCIFARKDEIRHIADVDQHRINEIRALEEEVTAAARKRSIAKFYKELRLDGLSPIDAYKNAVHAHEDSVKYEERTFFQGQNTRARQDGEVWPIDKVVAWSRTSRGGKQVELFAPPREGCMRWGLCDTGGDE
jgi:3'-phosphoadenosine 5'-phosphosulfate sulfotransferase (PAPS reductase)/FAD synthetase